MIYPTKHPVQAALEVDGMTSEELNWWLHSVGAHTAVTHFTQTIVNIITSHCMKIKRILSDKYEREEPFVKLLTFFVDMDDVAACLVPRNVSLYLNPIHCLYDPEYILTHVIPHEMAHFADYLDGGLHRENIHDDAWKTWCKILYGREFIVTHELPSKEEMIKTIEDRSLKLTLGDIYDAL